MHDSRGFRVDHAIARLAARQHELVARDQLRALGLTPRQIDYRLEIGRLHPGTARSTSSEAQR